MSAASQLQSLLLALSSAGVDLRQLRMRSENTVSVDRSPAERRWRRRRSSIGIAGTFFSAAGIRRREMFEGSGRRPRPSLVQRRVRNLRALVPVDGASRMRRSSAVNVGGLLQEAVDYISCLQLQVKVMRSMVDALSERSGR